MPRPARARARRREGLRRRHVGGGVPPWRRPAGGGGGGGAQGEGEGDGKGDDALFAAVCAAAEGGGHGYTYDGRTVEQLLRLARNASEHYETTLPAPLRRRIEARGGLASFFLARFRGLALAAWKLDQDLQG